MSHAPLFGNCCERVVDAVCEQAKTLMQTFNYPYTVPQALLAEKVCTTLGMDKIFYQNTGTEANEAMIKMARKYGVRNTAKTTTISLLLKSHSTAEHSAQ